MTTCITTFSNDGYELYGRKMIESWLEFWPKTFKLLIYTEGFDVDFKDDRLTILDLETACPNIKNFKQSSYDMHSHALSKKEKRRIEKTIKWCHKIYAMSHALKFRDDYLIFLDGDTYTTALIPETLPQNLVDTELFAVHFEILNGARHFETGLIVFNLTHEKIHWLHEILPSAYDSLEIYNMEKTWDGFWLAHLYELHNLPVKNLALEGRGVFGHRLIKGILHHDVGTDKYLNAGYNKFTGKKHDSRKSMGNN